MLRTYTQTLGNPRDQGLGACRRFALPLRPLHSLFTLILLFYYLFLSSAPLYSLSTPPYALSAPHAPNLLPVYS